VTAGFPIEQYLADNAKRVDHVLRRVLATRTEAGPARLTAALEHALLGGGKRLRPALVMASCQALGGDPSEGSLAMRFAVSLEMIHCYSLVHDDLPCMDDDDLRRGRPTVHKAFDEATAVLVGDALQALAFKHLLGTNDPVAAKLASVLASNAYLMVEGQALDMESEGRSLDEEGVLALQGGKSAALIAAACVGGAMAATGSGKGLYPAGYKLGLAFQIADDLLDLRGDAAALGKRTGKDVGAGKATLPALLGPDEARRRAERYADEVLATLAPLGAGADALRALACYIVARSR
jgi:farnesyl diphosphate synthase/geranylgeranyl diphosphate synthase type II